MLGELRSLATEARRDAGAQQLDIATRAGVSQEAVSRFERGEGWPRGLEAMIAAYESECKLEPGTLWRAAVERAFGA